VFAPTAACPACRAARSTADHHRKTPGPCALHWSTMATGRTGRLMTAPLLGLCVFCWWAQVDLGRPRRSRAPVGGSAADPGLLGAMRFLDRARRPAAGAARACRLDPHTTSGHDSARTDQSSPRADQPGPAVVAARPLNPEPAAPPTYPRRWPVPGDHFVIRRSSPAEAGASLSRRQPFAARLTARTQKTNRSAPACSYSLWKRFGLAATSRLAMPRLLEGLAQQISAMGAGRGYHPKPGRCLPVSTGTRRWFALHARPRCPVSVNSTRTTPPMTARAAAPFSSLAARITPPARAVAGGLPGAGSGWKAARLALPATTGGTRSARSATAAPGSTQPVSFHASR